MAEFDIFIKNSIYPNADNIFNTANLPLSEIKKDCLFVIDTNALLAPYYASFQDLQQIKSILSSLIERRRLFIPGQVAREFASNRSDRIKEIYQQLNKRLNTIQDFKISNYPLLNDTDEYKKLIKIENDFNAVTKQFKTEYKSQLDKVLNKIKEWCWNDPVSNLYARLFSKEIVFDLQIDDRDKLKKELERRYTHKIPPGYKDQSKMDEGIGDLLIWFTILELAKKYKKSVVFVSGEEKSDWVLKSDGQILYPRFELIAEFAMSAPGQSFHIIKLSELLELMEGSTKLINEFKEIENNFRKARGEIIMNDLFIHQLGSEMSRSPFEAFEHPILYQIDIELDSIKRTIVQFISRRDSNLVGNENFLDDLTTLHRNRILPFDIYKRLMNFYAIYGRKEVLPYEVHFKNLEEIMHLKSLTFDALANVF